MTPPTPEPGGADVQRVDHWLHLGRRFFGSLSWRPPSAADEAWAEGWLLEGERALWGRLSNADRRHAVRVAREVADRLGAQATRPVMAAALLHDCGKLDSGLGTFARVGATAWAGVRGRATVAASEGRVGRYVRHDELGAGMLAAAGSHPVTVAWARQHHLPATQWTLPAEVAAALKAADDD
jgi:hypothetical protein